MLDCGARVINLSVAVRNIMRTGKTSLHSLSQRLKLYPAGLRELCYQNGVELTPGRPVSIDSDQIDFLAEVVEAWKRRPKLLVGQKIRPKRRKHRGHKWGNGGPSALLSAVLQARPTNHADASSRLQG
jgi:hypothetical protein